MSNSVIVHEYKKVRISDTFMGTDMNNRINEILQPLEKEGWEVFSIQQESHGTSFNAIVRKPL